MKITPSPSSSSNVFQVAKARKPRFSKKASNSEKKKKKLDNGDGNGKRSSSFRGVTRHRWTGKYEAHLWDKLGWNPLQKKKGRQVYLGAYDDEEAAARTYDLAALKYWGPETALNFPFDTYRKDYEAMQSMSKEEYLASLRRRSNGFSRGVSKYRGVARHTGGGSPSLRPRCDRVQRPQCSHQLRHQLLHELPESTCHSHRHSASSTSGGEPRLLQL